MKNASKFDFENYLIQFPEQIESVLNNFHSQKKIIDTTKINNVICIGMGGSAIAGDVIKDIMFEEIKVPIFVNRGYMIPGFCNDKSLIVACSYSGNTEETLSAVEQAKQKKAQIAVITSGGELKGQAKQNKWPVMQIPGGLPPRQAFGYLFFSMLLLFSDLQLLSIEEKEIRNIVKLSQKLVGWNSDKINSDRILSKELAKQIHNKIPIIYVAAPFFDSVAMRWKTQFQENSKSMAFYNSIPEMNHNEIVGWEMEHQSLQDFIVIFLHNDNMPKRIAARIDLTKNIIREKGIDIAEIYAEGETRLEQAISLIILGDWISYYLALCYKRNPESILNIDYLKSELKKIV